MSTTSFKFVLKMLRNRKKGKIFLIAYVVAWMLDKTVYYSTLSLLETSLKDRIYKKYLKYRLKNINK
mgnify:CR=1 FL=1